MCIRDRFYGSAYLLVFTVLTWTLGIQLVKGGKMAFSWRTLLLNPCLLYTSRCV